MKQQTELKTFVLFYFHHFIIAGVDIMYFVEKVIFLSLLPSVVKGCLFPTKHLNNGEK